MPNLHGIRFLYNTTVVDSADIAVVPASAATDSQFPPEAVQDTQRGWVYKSTGTGNAAIRLACAVPLGANALGLVEHNLSAAALITPTCYSDEWLTAAYSESFEAVGAILGWLEGGWLAGGWLGYPAEEDLAAYPKIAGLYEFNQYAAGEHWEIAIDNGDDAADAFYLGRLLLGTIWKPEHNYQYGARRKLVSTARSDKSLGSVKWVDIGDKVHHWEITLHKVSDAEVKGALMKLLAYVGTEKAFLTQFQATDIKAARLTTVYGQFVSDPEITHAGPNRHQVKMTIEEVL